MANIQISEINSTGYNLLHDEESFLNELANQDTQTVIGGGYGKYWGNHSHGYSNSGYSGHYNRSCWF